MKTDEAIELADEWARHLTPHVQDGWRVACKALRRLRAEHDALRAELAEVKAALHSQTRPTCACRHDWATGAKV